MLPNPTDPYGGKEANSRLHRGGPGVVASVSPRVVNLRFDDGAVVGLLPLGAPIHPWACAGLLPTDLLAEGEAFVLRGPSLTVVEGFSLTLPECLTLDLAPRPKAPPDPGALASLLESKGALGPGPQDGPIADALQAWLAGGGQEALLPLLGLGDGLTPSGDDALCGALGLLHAAAPWQPAVRALLAAPYPTLEFLTTRSPRLSAQLVHSAFQGRFGQPILQVLEALETRHGLDLALAGLLSLGHNSGRDTLLGLATVARFLGSLPTEALHEDP